VPKINAAIAASNPRHSFGNNSKNKTNIAKPILSISLLTSSFQYTHHDVLYNNFLCVLVQIKLNDLQVESLWGKYRSVVHRL